MHCRLCGSKRVKKIKYISSPFLDLDYGLYRCSICKSQFFNPDEHQVDFRELNELLSEKIDTDQQFSPSTYWRNQVQRITKILEREPKKILDVGCNIGDSLLHWDESLVRHGIEVSRKACNIALKRGLMVYNSFLEEVHFEQTYDVVTCYAILEHLREPLQFMNLLSELVNTKGILVILIPCFQCLKRIYLDYKKVIWHMYSPPAHLNLFSREFLDSYLKAEGFELRSRYYTTGGMVTLFKKSGLLKRISDKLIYLFDEHSFFNRIQIFDHMY